MSLKDRAAATMAAGYRVYRVDGGILPSAGRAAGAATGGAAPGAAAGAPEAGAGVADAAARCSTEIAHPADHPGGGADPRRRRPGRSWMIDLHQKFDFHEAVEVCRLMEPSRPFCVEDPVREEQFRTQIPKLRLLTTVPLAPGEEWGTRAGVQSLVEQRDIDFARASLPNVGITVSNQRPMCDTHKVGIVATFTGPVATAGHMHTMMAFPGQVLMGTAQGDRPVPYTCAFLNCRNGRCGPTIGPALA